MLLGTIFGEVFLFFVFVEQICSQVKWWTLFFTKKGEDFFEVWLKFPNLVEVDSELLLMEEIQHQLIW